MSNKNTRRRLTAIDYFIIFTVVAVLLTAGLRLYKDSAPEDVTESALNEEYYIITYLSKGMNENSAKLLEKGEMFYMTGGEIEFGVLEDEPTVTPSRINVELENGELKTDVYATPNGNNSKADVTGAFRVKGCRTADDFLYVEGVLYVAPNMPVTVFSNDMCFSFTVTGIEKVS